MSKINELNSSLFNECSAIVYEKDYNEIMDYINELKKSNPSTHVTSGATPNHEPPKPIETEVKKLEKSELSPAKPKINPETPAAAEPVTMVTT